MRNDWDDGQANRALQHYGAQGIGADLALRVYSTRLLGRNPDLVLHGGGNTSVKTFMKDIFGEEVAVLCVKGSGWDMAQIEPGGLPAVRLEPLRHLRKLEALSDEDMVGYQRANLLDQSSPNPSVETLLHAFLPHKYIDHAHASAVLSISDQPDGEAICRDVFGKDMTIVPFVMPGFALAKLASEAYEQNPAVRGLILHKHGIFTFGETAREAYDTMIEMVSRAEARIAAAPSKTWPAARPLADPAPLEAIAPILRGACALDQGDGRWQRWVSDFRGGGRVAEFVCQKNIETHPWRGVITPDHIIRIKNRPLVLPPAQMNDLEDYARQVRARLAEFAKAYHAYFTTNNRAGDKTGLDPVPRVLMAPGLGIIGLGKTKKDAVIAADLAECAIPAVMDAERVGRFEPLPDQDLFDMEYWSLEQAKLGKAIEPPLARQVAVVTGGAGAIGAAIARALGEAGAEVALLDLDEAAAVACAAAISPSALGLACDVTDEGAVAAAFDALVRHFGGVDIVVSNAGAAWPGGIADMDEALLRRSFELNFFAHQRVARYGTAIMKAQGTGGCLLFNASKQAVNPGANFGAYGLPKATTLFLMRQYALEAGKDGIRANAVNADRIRSGLLDEAMITKRAKARGLSQKDYMAGNLLGLEVHAEDVAQAFVHLAMAGKTTGGITTVDGGNIAAALR